MKFHCLKSDNPYDKVSGAAQRRTWAGAYNKTRVVVDRTKPVTSEFGIMDWV